MICTLSFILNDELLFLELDADNYLNGLHINCHPLKEKEHITEVVVGENIVIIKQDPYYEGGNNINAYDWQGHHLWNIADIVGERNRMYDGGNICPMRTLETRWGFIPEKYSAGHTFYNCVSGGNAYIIDLQDRNVVQVLHDQK